MLVVYFFSRLIKQKQKTTKIKNEEKQRNREKRNK